MLIFWLIHNYDSQSLFKWINIFNIIFPVPLLLRKVKCKYTVDFIKIYKIHGAFSKDFELKFSENERDRVTGYILQVTSKLP